MSYSRLSIALLLVSLTAAPASWAQARRTVEVNATVDMKFSVTTIDAKPGELLRIKLIAVGPAMNKAAMAHNIVFLKPGTDTMAFGAAAAGAGPAANYVPPALKAQIIAASTLAGNGETVTLDFAAPKAPGSYPFICSFPGHYITMKGVLVVK